MKINNLLRSSTLMVFLKIATIIVSFAITRFSVNNIGTNNYGIWVTVFALITWMTISDMGLSNGLRNHLIVCLAKDVGDKEVNRLLGGSFKLILIYVLPVLVILSFIYLKLNFGYILSNLSSFTLVLLGSLIVLSKIHYSYVQAIIKPEKWSLIQFGSLLFHLLAVYILMKFEISDLDIFTIASAFSLSIPYLYLVFLSIIKFDFKIGLFTEERKFIINEGLNFFLIQLCSFIIYYSLPIVIYKVFSEKEVAQYGIINRYFSLSYGFFLVMISPLWSAVRMAKAVDAFRWKEIAYKYSPIVVFFLLILLVQVVIADDLLKLWLGPEFVLLEMKIYVIMACPIGISILTSFVSQIFNALSILRIQILTSLIVVIPLVFIYIGFIPVSSLYGLMLYYSMFLLCSAGVSLIYFAVVLNNNNE